MRNLRIKREKKLAACLGKVRLYIEDPAQGTTKIHGTLCRKLGVLKNGEEKTFEIDNEQAKVFAISGFATSLGKAIFSDFICIPEGDSDVQLSGRNYVSANGNAFLFNNNKDPEALRNRKKNKTIGTLLWIVVFLLGFLFGALIGQLVSGKPLTNVFRGFLPWFLALAVSAVAYGTPLMFGTLGEILTEKSGNLNLGVEGIMFMGGAFGLGGAYYYNQLASHPNGYIAIAIAILCAFLAGALASLIYSFITITLRANQNVTGLALSIFGTGVGQFTGEFMRVKANSYITLSNDLKEFFVSCPFPKFIQRIPVVGKLLFGHGFFFYLGIIIAIALALYLNRTRLGLYLRAVGESPATADAAGINITLHKYLATTIGGGISAIGGVVFITTIAGCTWNHEGLSGFGWLSVALVIFCLWRPTAAIWSAVLFGALVDLYNRLHLAFLPDEIYKILPYVVTVIVLILSSLRNNKEKQPPAALGLAFFREER